MSEEILQQLIFAAGICQFCILIASALVPIRLKWWTEFRSLPRLHRQLYWVYGGYVVLSIISFGSISVLNAGELAHGSMLARSFCAYVAVFWGVRLTLQAILDVKDHLTTWWLKLGYNVLSLLFAGLTVLFGWAALHPVG